MKKGILFTLLVLTPLFTTASPDRYVDIYGVWEDYYSGISFRIKPGKRNSLLVRRLDRSRNSRWQRYDRVSRTRFEDRNGNQLRISRNGLSWHRRNGRRSYFLERPGDQYFRSNRRNNGYCPPDYGYERNRFRRTNNLAGSWYCADHDLNIDVDYYDNGIRVRRFDRRSGRYERWYDYRQDRRGSNRYYGNNDKYYEWDDNTLTFYDERKRKRFRFKRN